MRPPIFHATVVSSRCRERRRRRRCSGAGSTRCRRCSSTCRARSTSGRRARPAGRRRCPPSATARQGVPRRPRHDLARGPHLGQQRRGMRSRRSRSSSQRPRVDVEEHRARGIASRIGDMDAPAGQFPDEPRVDGAEGELAGVGRARAPATWSSSQAIFVPEKYASMSSPVFSWIIAAGRPVGS